MRNTIARTTVSRRGFVCLASGAFIAATTLATPALADVQEIFSAHDASSTVAVDHSAWTELLSTYIKPDGTGLNLVDYAAWKASGHDKLRAYVKTLEGTDVTKLNRNEQFAFWANLYNAKTIDVVLDAYPVESIKDISLGGSIFSVVTGGPWDGEVTSVNGEALTLNNIEHDIMRPIFQDPRVHYAVNCASIGCPNLGTEAFTGQDLEKQLDAGAKAFVNHPRGVRFEDGDDLVVSKIYSWFDEDFGNSEEGVIAHVAKYAEPELKAKIAKVSDIYDYEYDWGLNDVAKPSTN